MRAGAERPGRVDDDRQQPGCGLLPGRADPQRTDGDRPVEGTPTLLPACLDVRTTHAAEGVPEALLAGCVGVRSELDIVLVLDLLESFREQLDHRRACLLGAAAGNGDR